MKKRLIAIFLVLFLMLGLCACNEKGKKVTDNYNDKDSVSDNQYSEDDRLNADNHGADNDIIIITDNSNDYTILDEGNNPNFFDFGDNGEEKEPQITLLILDQKHADIIIDCSSMVGGSPNNWSSFEIFLPGDMRLYWSPDWSQYYHSELGGFGKLEQSIDGDMFTFHIDMTPNPEANYTEKMAPLVNYSFEDLSKLAGEIYHIQYNVNGEANAHGGDYALDSILDMSMYVNSDDKNQEPETDWKAALVGTWEYIKKDGGMTTYTFYKFFPNGRYLYYVTTSTFGLTLEGARKEFRELGSPDQYNTYSFDGKELGCSFGMYNVLTGEYEYSSSYGWPAVLDGDQLIRSGDEVFNRISE